MRANMLDALKLSEGALAHNKMPEVNSGTHVPTKTFSHMVHRKSANGGHIFEHHFAAPFDGKAHMQEHTFDNHDDAIDHFIKHGTEMNPGEAEAEAGTPDEYKED